MHSKKLVWFVLPSLALSAHAQVTTNTSVRLLSLSETLELALSHDLNLKMERLLPVMAQYNVQLARAGGSSRVGIQNFVPGDDRLTARDASYDPTFFIQGRKTYDSQPNPLTYSRQQNLQGDINQINQRGFESEAAAERETQAEAQRDLIRSSNDIRTFPSRIAEIDEDLRAGRIDLAEAQLQRQDEQAQFENAQATQNQANLILANSASRLSSAQARDTQTLSRIARAQDAQDFLNRTRVGAEIPSQGLLDPDTGYRIYQREVSRFYDFSTGLRGAMPIGTVWELSLSAAQEKNTLFDQQYYGVAAITVGQPLLKNFLIDEGRTLLKTSKKDFEKAEWQLQFVIADTLTRATIAYYDLVFAQENVKVQEKALQLANTFLSETTSRVKAGTVPILDQRQAEYLAASANADLLSARRDLAVRENLLRNMITDDYAEMVNTTIIPSEKLVGVPEIYSKPESWSKALTLRPEYNQARLELEKQNIMLKFAKNQMLPQLDLVGSLAGNGIHYHSYSRAFGDIDDRSPNYWFGAIFSTPIFNRADKANYKLTQAEKERAVLAMKKLEQSILTEVDNNIQIAQVDYVRIDATRKAREFSEMTEDAIRKKAEVGKATSLEVLTAQRDLTAARFAEINALAAYNKALAMLYFSEGTTLERHNIRLNVEKPK